VEDYFTISRLVILIRAHLERPGRFVVQRRQVALLRSETHELKRQKTEKASKKVPKKADASIFGDTGIAFSAYRRVY
jgi:hypothetical protein